MTVSCKVQNLDALEGESRSEKASRKSCHLNWVWKGARGSMCHTKTLQCVPGWAKRLPRSSVAWLEGTSMPGGRECWYGLTRPPGRGRWRERPARRGRARIRCAFLNHGSGAGGGQGRGREQKQGAPAPSRVSHEDGCARRRVQGHKCCSSVLFFFFFPLNLQ